MRSSRTPTRWLWLLSAAAVLLGACQTDYSRFARRADRVGAAVAVEQSPRVQLDIGHGAEPKAGVVEPGEQARSGFEAVIYLASGVMAAGVAFELERRFREVMPRDKIEAVIRSNIAMRLSTGQPFGYAQDSFEERPDGTLFVDVVDYGIVTSDNGPAFVVELRFRIYEAGSNELVYEEGVSCRDKSFFLSFAPRQPVTTMALVSFFRSMDDLELGQRIRGAFEGCTAKMVSKLRSDAGK